MNPVGRYEDETMLSDRTAGITVWFMGLTLLGTSIGTALLVSSEVARDYVGLAASYKVGQRLDTREFYTGAKYTVVLFARSTCGASKASMPQLRAIATVTDGMDDVQFVVVPTAAWSDDERDFVESIGLSEANVRHEQVEDLKVQVVPTLVVVNRRGRIRYIRESRLSDLNVAEIRTVLSEK